MIFCKKKTYFLTVFCKVETYFPRSSTRKKLEQINLKKTKKSVDSMKLKTTRLDFAFSTMKGKRKQFWYNRALERIEERVFLFENNKNRLKQGRIQTPMGQVDIQILYKIKQWIKETNLWSSLTLFFKVNEISETVCFRKGWEPLS